MSRIVLKLSFVGGISCWAVTRWSVAHRVGFIPRLFSPRFRQQVSERSSLTRRRGNSPRISIKPTSGSRIMMPSVGSRDIFSVQPLYESLTERGERGVAGVWKETGSLRRDRWYDCRAIVSMRETNMTILSCCNLFARSKNRCFSVPRERTGNYR